MLIQAAYCLNPSGKLKLDQLLPVTYHVVHEKVHACAWCLPRAIQAREAISDCIHALQQRALEVEAVKICCYGLPAQINEGLQRNSPSREGVTQAARALLIYACQVLEFLHDMWRRCVQMHRALQKSHGRPYDVIEPGASQQIDLDAKLSKYKGRRLYKWLHVCMFGTTEKPRQLGCGQRCKGHSTLDLL